MEQLVEIITFTGGVLIAFYSTHQAVIVIAGRARDWMEVAAGLGGLLFLFGVYLTGSRVLDANYLIAYSFQSLGVGLMLLPRIVRITIQALRDC